MLQLLRKTPVPKYVPTSHANYRKHRNWRGNPLNKWTGPYMNIGRIGRRLLPQPKSYVPPTGPSNINVKVKNVYVSPFAYTANPNNTRKVFRAQLLKLHTNKGGSGLNANNLKKQRNARLAALGLK
jgi:hypothetical protein